jgi:hypothetical protein
MVAKTTSIEKAGYPTSKISSRYQIGADKIQYTLNNFAPIGLNEMDKVTLLNRTDTKFVMTIEQLAQALRSVSDQYRVLVIEHQRIQHYRTLYFDTPKFDFYHRQTSGYHDIFKVRTREYMDTRVSFLEVKYKDQKKRTDKKRLCTQAPVTALDENVDEFLGDYNPYTSKDLEPKLWNTFTRITLVSKYNLERLTIDFDLGFFNDERAFYLDGIVIAEVKQDGFSTHSDFIQLMRQMGLRSSGFSKYCFGASLLFEQLKHNVIKPKLLMVNKLNQGAIRYARVF